MSTVDVQVLGPPQADDVLHPEFAVVLRGFDPEEVRDYVDQVADRIERLQGELREARAQIEAVKRQFGAAKEAAYKQLATQMAELLHTADQEAERLRREGMEDAARRTAEAARHADAVRTEAEDAAEEIHHAAELEAEAMRNEGREVLWRARSEAERIFGGLSIHREQMLGELEATGARLTAVLQQLGSVIEITRHEAEEGPPIGSIVGNGEGPDAQPAVAARSADLLGSMEGFDLVLPEVRIEEPAPDEPDRTPEE